MGVLLNLYYDVLNIVSIMVNGIWCIWCYQVQSCQRSTYIYDEDKQLKLDFYPTTLIHSRPMPLILYAHGGGWVGGSRKNIPPAILAQLDRGYTIASISYSLMPKHKYPTPINDIVGAFKWIQDHHDELGIDPHRIIGWGLSAGAQIINYAAIQKNLFAGVISWYGFSDLVIEDANYFHRITRLLIHNYSNGAQPIITNRVNSETCSFYIVHGAKDRFVPIDQSERLYRALSKSKQPSQLKEYPNYYHGDWRLNYKSELQEFNTFLDLVSKADLLTN